MSFNLYNFERIPKFNKPIFIIGAFESFHLGHYELYKKALEINNDSNRDIVIVLFKDPENFYLYTDTGIFSDFENRIQELANLDFQQGIYLEYKNIKLLEPNVFIDKLLKNQEDYHIVVGEDFKYGFNAKGNTTTLIDQIGEENLSVVSFLKLNESIKISTTFLKECLELGDIELVNSLNCYKYSFTGIINTNELNQNILITNEYLTSLRKGYYLSYVEINNYTYYAILQFNNTNEHELHFIDFTLKNNEKFKARIIVLKPLRFFNDLDEKELNEKDYEAAKKEFIKM